VGNGCFYGGGMVVAPQAGLDEGLLDVYALPWGSWWVLLGVARSFKSGVFVYWSGVHHYRTAHVHIATRPPLPINMDGDLVGRTPLHFAVAPGALRVLVPHASPAAARWGHRRLAPR
jgi:diacylglycerol kinase (ATP)